MNSQRIIRISWGSILSLLFIITIFPLTAQAAVVNLYANFDYLKNPFTEWYHGGISEIVDEGANKVLRIDGGSSGRVLGVDIQKTPYVKLKMNFKINRTTDGYMRVLIFEYPMSSEGYREDRELCGIYIDSNYLYSFNGTISKLTEVKGGWDNLQLNLNVVDGLASLEYGDEKYIFSVPISEARKYFIFRVDPGTEAYLDEIDLKAGFDYYELFDAYTFSKEKKVSETPPPVETPAETSTPYPLPMPDFSRLRILLDRNYELLYKTNYYGHDFYIVKYYNYIPAGSGVEIVTERGFKIGINDKDYARAIIDTVNVSEIEKDLLYRAWEDRQNGVVAVYMSIIAFLLFLLGILAVIIWKA
jgi:hypothetical protein